MALLIVGCSTAHQLSTSVVPVGGGTISPSSGLFKDKVTLIANPAQYYKFIGWGGNASGNINPLTISMNSDKNIVAQFEKNKYTVQIKSNPSDGGIVHPDSGQYEAGSKLSVTATAANGYRFAQWGTDASGNANPLSALIDRDMIIVGNFIKQYKLTVSADPNLGTISPNGGIYDAGTTVNFTATPAFPYAFKNWVGSDDNNANPTKLTMNADKSVSVTFVQLPKKTGPITTGGQHIYNGNGIVPIDLSQFEWVEGTIDCGTFPQVHVYIQGPDGKNIKDFGSIGQANFRIMAPVSGKYSVVVEANFVYGANYNVTYTVYGLQ